MTGVNPGACQTCGRPVDDHDRNIRYLLPDPVANSAEQGRADDIWFSHGDPNSSVMMQSPTFGPFVRALLPVHLSDGHTVTFGVWVGVHPDDLQAAFAVWWEPEYPSLRLEGRLANSVPPWGLLAVPVSLAVRDPEHTPYCVASPDATLTAVLNDAWPREDVLAT